MLTNLLLPQYDGAAFLEIGMDRENLLSLFPPCNVFTGGLRITRRFSYCGTDLAIAPEVYTKDKRLSIQFMTENRSARDSSQFEKRRTVVLLP